MDYANNLDKNTDEYKIILDKIISVGEFNNNTKK